MRKILDTTLGANTEFDGYSAALDTTIDPTGVMLLTRRQPDSPATALNKFCSMCTPNRVYTEFGIDPGLNREIRRRTRVVGSFPDGNSALMLVCARLRHVAGTQWGNKKYMNMKHLEAAVEDASIAG